MTVIQRFIAMTNIDGSTAVCVKVEDHEQEVAALNARNERLEAENAALKAEVTAMTNIDGRAE